MSQESEARRRNARIKFKGRIPKILYRQIPDSRSREVNLLDLSETGFSFLIDADDETTQVGHVLYVDFKDLNNGKSTDFTARVVRVHLADGQPVFSAEFISVTSAFKKRISKLSKLYLRANYFLVERRTPLSIGIRASMKPVEIVALLYQELRWKLANREPQLQPLPKTQRRIGSISLTKCIDFNQI